MESKWDFENRVSIERNMHNEIIEHCAYLNEKSRTHFQNIENEITFLKKMGFDVIFSVKIDS